MSDLFKNKIDIEKGKIYSIADDTKEIATNTDKDGYFACAIYDKYRNPYYRVHDVIIAEAMNLPKHLWPFDSYGRYQVNHKDENKQNNSITNLELVSLIYNLRYGDRDKRAAEARVNHPKMSKKVYQYKDGELIAEYPSLSEASRQTGFQLSKISQCCKGGYFDKRFDKWFDTKTYKGFEFSFNKKETE